MGSEPAIATREGERSLPATFGIARLRHLGLLSLAFFADVYGFSRTTGDVLVHPESPAPWVLYLHAGLAAAWLLFVVTQSTLVVTRRRRLHQRLGLFGFGLWAVFLAVSLVTTFVTRRVDVALHGLSPARTVGLAVPLQSALVALVLLGLAFVWRRRPDFHLRAIVAMTCAVSEAGVGRLPRLLVPGISLFGLGTDSLLWFFGVDLIVVLGIVGDALVERRVHPVYAWALPALVGSQAAMLYLMNARPAAWIAVTGWMVR